MREEQSFMINCLVLSDKVSVFGPKGLFDEVNVRFHL